MWKQMNVFPYMSFVVITWDIMLTIQIIKALKKIPTLRNGHYHIKICKNAIWHIHPMGYTHCVKYDIPDTKIKY